MRVLYASTRPPYPFFIGGAARSAHQILREMAATPGVQCLATGSMDFHARQWAIPPEADHGAMGVTALQVDSARIEAQCGYPVQLLPDFENALGALIDRWRPDVVWTQLDGFDRVMHIARSRGCRVLVFLRDAEDEPEALQTLALSECCLVVNSRFMAQRVRQLTGRRVPVVYPSLERSFGVGAHPQGALTMINPVRAKGVETFIEIARLMPEQRFLLVESWKFSPRALEALHEALAPVPNVEFRHRVNDVAVIYRETRLLLAPSIWEEAFGRVVIEAQSCGIPVIASRRGGLPESVGDGGVIVDEHRNAQRWVQEIRRLLDDPALYGQLARKAREHAASRLFTAQHAASQFLEICADRSNFRVPLTLRARKAVERAFATKAAA